MSLTQIQPSRREAILGSLVSLAGITLPKAKAKYFYDAESWASEVHRIAGGRRYITAKHWTDVKYGYIRWDVIGHTLEFHSAKDFVFDVYYKKQYIGKDNESIFSYKDYTFVIAPHSNQVVLNGYIIDKTRRCKYDIMQDAMKTVNGISYL